MSVEYADYTRDRVGFFFGMTGPQLATVMAAGVPLLLAVGVQRWALAGLCLLGFAAVVLLVVVPVRGRSATQWIGALVAHTVGRGLGWSAFRGKVGVGEPVAPDDADLPGILAGVQVHDGPPRGARLTRVALIQDHAAQTWAATARVVHPGIGIAEARERDRMGEGLAQLQEVLARTDLARMLVIQVRTVPDDGAERAQWVAKNRRADSPALSRRVNDDLAVSLTAAGVRTEAFVTVVVAESAIARPARQAGRGLIGRARVLYGLLAEVEAHLLGAVRCTSVDWLDSADLAAAVRTGFAPSDRAVLVQAAADAATHPGTSTAGAVGGGRTGAGKHAGALVQPRRLVLGVGGGAAAGPGRHPRGVGAGAGPRDPGGAALLHRLLPAGLGPQGLPLVAPARRSPPPPVGRCAAGSGSRPGPGSDATRPRPTPWTPSWPAAGRWSGPPRSPR